VEADAVSLCARRGRDEIDALLMLVVVLALLALLALLSWLAPLVARGRVSSDRLVDPRELAVVDDACWSRRAAVGLSEEEPERDKEDEAERRIVGLVFSLAFGFVLEEVVVEEEEEAEEEEEEGVAVSTYMPAEDAK
jgi:hypothetical protein